MTELAGKTIGDYQIYERIDGAGKIHVYHGVQNSTNHAVAIMALNPEVASDHAAVQAFNQHAQMAARVAHPNVLPVLDSGQEAGVDYLVTPYMAGGSVADQRSSYAELTQVLALFRTLAPGLETIYNQGTIHGNLRPTKIILDAQGRPLLSGMGMAFRQGETPTPYNSPEQVQGGAVDRQTDIYALGVILYELLAGQAPVPGTTLNLQAVRPDLPASVGGVVQKATAQNPDQRYQTLGEFLNALAETVQPAQIPVPAPPSTPTPTPTPVQQGPPPQKRTNWMGFILGGLVVIVLCLVVVVVGPMVYDALNPEADQPVAEQPIVEEPVVEVPTTQPIVEEPVVEVPTAQPIVEEPPEVEVPEPGGERELPEPPGEGEGGGLQDICGSVVGAGGIVLLPGFFALRRRRRA